MDHWSGSAGQTANTGKGRRGLFFGWVPEAYLAVPGGDAGLLALPGLREQRETLPAKRSSTVSAVRSQAAVW